MAEPPPQTLALGSAWPPWATKDFFELCLQRLAAQDGFGVVEWTSRTSANATYGLMCEHDLWRRNEERWCSFRVRVKVVRTAGKADASTSEACLTHNHELTQYSKKRRAFRREAKRFAKEAEERIVEAAKREIYSIKQREGFRIGYETEDVDLSDVWPEQQRAVVDDVRRAVGESAARALLWKVEASRPRADFAPSRSPSPLSSAHSSLAASSSDTSSSDETDSNEAEETSQPRSAPHPPPQRKQVAVQASSSAPQRLSLPDHPSAPGPPPQHSRKRSRSPSPSAKRWTSRQVKSHRDESDCEIPQPLDSKIATSCLASEGSSPHDSAKTTAIYREPRLPTAAAIQAYLPTPPTASPAAIFDADLQAYLSSIFPPSSYDDVPAAAEALRLTGISSLSDLASFLLLDKSAILMLVGAVKSSGATEHECWELARVLRLMREAGQDDGLPVEP
ncbi:hypothetical protein JCM10213_002434 [Rhodosporidiobolus nylandii]